MCDPDLSYTAVKHQLSSILTENLAEDGARFRLVPAGADERAAVGERFIEARVALDARIAEEGDVGRDPHLREKHEQVAESRDAGLFGTRHLPADHPRRVGERPLAQHDEHALSRG